MWWCWNILKKKHFGEAKCICCLLDILFVKLQLLLGRVKGQSESAGNKNTSLTTLACSSWNLYLFHCEFGKGHQCVMPWRCLVSSRSGDGPANRVDACIIQEVLTRIPPQTSTGWQEVLVGGRRFSPPCVDSLTSITCVQHEPAVTWEETRAPLVNLPVLLSNATRAARGWAVCMGAT